MPRSQASARGNWIPYYIVLPQRWWPPHGFIQVFIVFGAIHSHPLIQIDHSIVDLMAVLVLLVTFGVGPLVAGEFESEDCVLNLDRNVQASPTLLMAARSDIKERTVPPPPRAPTTILFRDKSWLRGPSTRSRSWGTRALEA
jgi:hypothetical protein